MSEALKLLYLMFFIQLPKETFQPLTSGWNLTMLTPTPPQGFQIFKSYKELLAACLKTLLSSQKCQNL